MQFKIVTNNHIPGANLRIRHAVITFRPIKIRIVKRKWLMAAIDVERAQGRPSARLRRQLFACCSPPFTVQRNLTSFVCGAYRSGHDALLVFRFGGYRHEIIVRARR